MASVSSLQDTLERYLLAPPDERPAALRPFLANLREAINGGDGSEALPLLQKAVLPTCDYTSFQSLYRVYSAIKPWVQQSLQQTKLAILGGFTTTQLAQAIELALFSMGGAVELFEADYGTYRQEILDPASELFRWQPKTIFWRQVGAI